MASTVQEKSGIIEEFKRHDSDTGSPEVQVALLTDRIQNLSGHIKVHKHDNHTRRGLVLLVGKRNRLLRYLARIDRERYQTLIERLGLRK